MRCERCTEKDGQMDQHYNFVSANATLSRAASVNPSSSVGARFYRTRTKTKHVIHYMHKNDCSAFSVDL